MTKLKRKLSERVNLFVSNLHNSVVGCAGSANYVTPILTENFRDKIAGLTSPNPLFDMEWYSKRYRVRSENVIEDYLKNHRRRNPHPLFNSEYYYSRNPDIVGAEITAIEHYWLVGHLENRSPNPVLWENWYKLAYGLAPDTKALLHYVTEGAARGNNPSLLFDTNRVAERLSVSAEDALLKYTLDKNAWSVNVIDHFDFEHLQRFTGNQWKFENAPILEYELRKELWSCKTSAHFDGEIYLSLHKDISNSDLSPLAHYLMYGANERRAATVDHMIQGLAPWDRQYHDHVKAEFKRCTLPEIGMAFTYTPKISILVPLFSTPKRYLEQLVESLEKQTYSAWEICFSVANNMPMDTAEYLKKLAKKSKFKFYYCTDLPGISANTNQALRLAEGDYIALLDHDDLLSDDALYECVKALNANRLLDFIYSDKDLITDIGNIRKNPLYKPDLSPEIMLSANYMTHFNVIRRSLIEKIGGWDPETDGAQDWDIFLRCLLEGAIVGHIPRVLYHWREAPTSVSGGIEAKPYARNGQLRAIQKYLDASRWRGATACHDDRGQFRIDWSKNIHDDVEVVFYNTQQGARFPDFLDGTLRPRVVTLSGELSISNVVSMLTASHSKKVVFLDATLRGSKDLLDQLIGPLKNKDISAVTGVVFDESSGKLAEAGYCYDGGRIQALFRNHDITNFGWFGGAGWFRNVSFTSFKAIAINNTASLRKLLGRYASLFQDNLLAFSRIFSEAGRIMVNPYASVSGTPQIVSADYPLSSYADNLFSPHLQIEEDGSIKLRPIQQPRQEEIVLNYSAEAGYWAERFDSIRQAGHATRMRVKAKHQRRALFILPGFDNPYYGGVYTILRYADHLMSTKDVFVDFLIESRVDYKSVRDNLDLILNSNKFGVFCASEYDERVVLNTHYEFGFASLWTTAYRLTELGNVVQKYYFVQDFEPSFYSGGTTSALCEATYRLGLKGICNSIGVFQKFKEAGGSGGYFTPPIDLQRFYPASPTNQRGGGSEPVRIFAYARPFNQRNCFEILARALKQLKNQFGQQIEIFTAGAHWSPERFGLAEVVSHLGMLTLDECAALYRKIDVGISFMASAHPSYPPLEMMACGVAVAANFNSSNLWLYEHGSNCELFEPNVGRVVETVSALVMDPQKRSSIQRNALKTAREKLSSWKEAFADIDSLVFEA